MNAIHYPFLETTRTFTEASLKSDLKHGTEAIAGVTEILLSNAGTSLKLITSMLAHLSTEQDGRWFTWINPPKLEKSGLSAAGFGLASFRCVRLPAGQAPTDRNKHKTTFDFLIEALMLGNSRTVVTSMEGVSQRQLLLIENAAHIGNTRCIILRPR